MLTTRIALDVTLDKIAGKETGTDISIVSLEEAICIAVQRLVFSNLKPEQSCRRLQS